MLITELTKEDIHNIIEDVIAAKLNELKSDLLNSQTPIEEEFLTREEACKILKVSLNSLDTYRRINKIASYYICGNVRLKKSDIHKFLTDKK